MTDTQEPTFQDELEALINKHCLERHSHTPDFILAEYMADCLHMFNKAVFARTKFYAPIGEAVEQITQADVGWDGTTHYEQTQQSLIDQDDE